MALLSELLVRISADTKGLSDGFSKLNNELKTVSGNVSRNLAGFEKLGQSMTSVGMSMTVGITAPLVALGGAALMAAGKMEQASVAFTTMMKSSQAAAAHLAQLRDFALKTPFQFTELIDASRRMQALGFSAKEIVPTLRTIGNSVSALGLGSEGLNRIILALGQMRAKGTAQAEEMRQLAEAGIPAWDALAKKLGTDVAGAMKLVEKRAVDSQTAISAVLEFMDQRFGGGMEAQAKTFLGLMSNVKDAISFTLADIGKALLPLGKDVLKDQILPLLNSVSELGKAFSELPKSAQLAVIGFGAVAAAIPPLILATGLLITNLKAVLEGLVFLQTIGVGPWVILAAKIGAVVVAMKLYNDEMERTQKVGLVPTGAPIPLWNIQGRLQQVHDATRDFTELNKIQNEVSANKWLTLWNVDPIKKVAEAVKTAVDTIGKAFQTLGLKNVKSEANEAQKAFDTLRAAGVLSAGQLQTAYRNLQEHLKSVKESAMTIQDVFSQQVGKMSLNAPDLRDFERSYAFIKDSLDKISNTATAERGLRLLIPPLLDNADNARKAAEALGYLKGAFDGAAGASTRLMAALERLKIVDVESNLKEVSNAVEDVGEALERGEVSVYVYLRAWLELIKAMKAAGQAIDPKILTEAEKVQGELDKMAGAAKRQKDTMSQQISTIATDLSRSMADLIIKGGKFKDVLADIGKAMLRMALEAQFKRILGLVTDLVSQSNTLKKVWDTIFGTMSSAGSAAGSAAGKVSGTAGGGGAGGVSSAASGGVAGWIGAISSAVSAVSGVIGNFQMAGMNKSLDLIEHETRFSQIHLLNILEKLNEYIPNLKDLMGYMWNFQAPVLRDVLTYLGSGNLGGGITTGQVNFSFSNCNFAGTSSVEVERMMNVAFAKARTAGAIA